MTPVEISNATRVLAKDQDEYLNLHICDQVVDGQNNMISLWQPNADDLEMIKNGGLIKLSIVGQIHPPVWVEIQPAE